MTTRRWGKIFLIVLIGLASASLGFAQAGRGVGRLGGTVTDSKDRPIQGAKVILIFSQATETTLEATTGKKGDFSFLGLGTGNFIIKVTAAGYVPEQRNAYVSQLAVTPKVTVKLQKIESSTKGGMIQDETSLSLIDEGNNLFKQGQYDAARVIFEEFYQKNPMAYQILVSIGDCYKEKDDFEKAVEYYNKALEGAAKDAVGGKTISAKAQAGIGNCYLKQNKLQEAQDFFKKSIENSPNDEILAYNVGEIYFSNQNADEALKYLDIASKIKPEWPDPYFKMGYVNLNKGDNANAIVSFEKFLKLEPETERAGQVKNILAFIKK